MSEGRVTLSSSLPSTCVAVVEGKKEEKKKKKEDEEEEEDQEGEEGLLNVDNE